VNVFFPAAADLEATDRFLIDGLWYAADSEPECWRTYAVVKARRAVR
jgi:hypothetical protein